MHQPTKHHFGGAKRVLRYLAGSAELGIWYRKCDSFNLEGSSDSGWGGEVDGRRSTTGNCLMLGSSIISWSSKKQATVALSFTEAEYVALTATACQAVWLRRLLGEEQSQASIFIVIAKNPVFHSRTKHREIKHHFIREQKRS